MNMIMPIPITEKVHVPTVDAIKNVLGMASRLEENIEQWEDVIDFTSIDEMAATLKAQGREMFHHILDCLDDAGLDIHDPLHMLLFIKKFDAALFEETFHPAAGKNEKAGRPLPSILRRRIEYNPAGL
ncbi:hypothetical protein [Hominibacterium faecale]|uniref:hypothetical protein n=1 Tax=Hominibacterium faecale TaxID=2839743 RepID=UPI0022B2A637|nr:hypothetical protein [Hominibacterium faecale]